MFIITNTDINNAFCKKTWENDKRKAERIYDDVRKRRSITTDDLAYLELFSEITKYSRKLYAANHDAVDGYLQMRQILADHRSDTFSTEDFDYVLKSLDKPIGVSTSTTFGNIDFDAIATMGYMPRITKIVSNEPNTVIYFNDGSKTVATCEANDVFDAEKGIYIALLKKTLGSHNMRNLLTLINSRTINETKTADSNDDSGAAE